MDYTPIAVVKETHLSRKPAEGSGLVAAASLLVIFGFSLVYWSGNSVYAQRLPASWESAVGRAEYWRLMTTMFIHGDLQHYLVNAFAFGVLSYLLYGYFGPLVYPGLTFALSALVTLISLATYPPGTILVGASGVVYLMAAFWLTMYLFLERTLSIGKRFMRAGGFTLVMLVPTTFQPQTSYRTHALGFAAGVFFAVCFFLARKKEIRNRESIEWE